MKTLESYIDIKNLDKSDWKSYKFGQIAKSISERVEPTNTDLEIYVGLEHLDPESIHIKRFGKKDDVSGTKLRCYPGDIIFGRRRAYQRKAAIVEFDGFCSAHSLVLRANPEVIDPKLFPFFLHSDTFMHRAIDISVGSLSPTINWGTLKNEEFLLPPKDQQAHLAELLWAADECTESIYNLKDKLDLENDVLKECLISSGISMKGLSRKLRFGKVYEKWEILPLGSFCRVVGGNAFESNRFKESGQVQVLRITNITKFGFDYTKSPVFVDTISEAEQKFLIPEKAIVVSLTGTNGKRDYGFPCFMQEHNKHLLNQRLAMIQVDSRIMIPEFLFLLSKLELFQGPFFLNAIGTANQANVSMNDIVKIELPVPPIQEQLLIVERIRTIDKAIKDTEHTIENLKQLQKSLLNQIF